MEANIISFKVFLDRKGRLMTKLSCVPDEELSKVFTDPYTQNYIRVVLRECHLKFDDLHEYLEKHLEALKHV